MPKGYVYSEQLGCWVREQQEPRTPSCDFNIGVRCYPEERRCATCGHNPEVAKARLQKLFPNYKLAKS